MDWIILTALSIFFRSIYGIMTKVLSNRAGGSFYTQAALLPLAGALVTVIASPLLGGFSLNVEDISYTTVMLVILGQGLGNMAYFAAIKNLTNGTAQIAFSSILAFNTILGLLFLGLHLSPLNLFGVVLLMLAILMVVNGKVELNRGGIVMMILSAFLFAVFQLSSAELSQHVSAASYLVIAYLGAALVVFALKAQTVIKDLKDSNKQQTLMMPVLTALPSIGNFLFAYYAYRIAPEPAKVAMLLTAQVVLTVFLSYFLLKEKEHLFKKVIAAVLVVVSAVLIKG